MPKLSERLSTVWSALTGKAIPFPQSSGSSTVPVYSSWADWDTARNGQYSGSKINYANRVGPPEQSSLVMAAVRWLGNTLPEADLQVKESSGEEGEAERVANHGLTKLWRKPNPCYSGSTLMKAFAFSWIINGNVYAVKWRDGFGRVEQLWYEPHWTIRPRWYGDGQGSFIRAEGDDPNALIAYYEVVRDNKSFRVETNDVIHFRDGFDPANLRCGLSGLGSVLRELYGDNEAAAYFGRLMAGSAVPPLVLSIDNDAGQLKEEDIEGLKDKLKRATSGDNKGDPIVVTGGKVFRLSFSPEELDLRVSRYMSEERFCAVTGIPGVVLELGSAQEHSIYNNVKQGEERAIESYLVPLYRHIEEEVTVQLLPDFEREGSGRYCRYDVSKMRALQEDEDAKHKRVAGDFQADLIKRSEARSALGYEFMPEDEIYFSQIKSGEPEPDADVLDNDLINISKSNGHIKKMPSEQDIKDAEEWFDSTFPPEVPDLFNAKIKH